MFIDKLNLIRSDLDNHRRTHDEIFEKTISQRLNTSLQNYIDELSKSYTYVSDKNSMNVMKTIIRKGQ